MRFSARARRMRPHVPLTSVLPHRTLGRWLESGHAPPHLLGRPVFRYPLEPSRDLAGAIRAPAALVGFDPSRRCSRPRVSGRLRPSDPPAVSPAPCSTRGVCCESDRPAKPSHPLFGRGLHRPRAPAAAPGLRPRGRSVPDVASPSGERAPGRLPPWAFPLSGIRTPALGTASGPCRSWVLRRFRRDASHDSEAGPITGPDPVVRHAMCATWSRFFQAATGDIPDTPALQRTRLTPRPSGRLILIRPDGLPV